MGTRALEVIEWVYRIEASICIFTEVGELRNTNKLPYFNIFYQKGMNHSGGVYITVGKHLGALHIEICIPNTVVIDLKWVSEPVRIIVIYWPNSQNRNLDDILSFTMQGTILSGNFNATVKERNSLSTDKRGTFMKENNLNYIDYHRHHIHQNARYAI